VIGAGNMGAALVRGWTRTPLADMRIAVFDVEKERAAMLADDCVVRQVASLEELARTADTIVVVVKPKDCPAVLRTLAPLLGAAHSVVSVAMGLDLQTIRALIGAGPTVYRIMPNLGVAIGDGVVALSGEKTASAEQLEQMRALFEGMGTAEIVSEDQLDAVTAVAGSSIAYLALALEGMEDGAVKVGMPRGTARRMVRQTAVAAARLLLAQAGSAADLKDQVSSPGGTTIAGLAVLEEQGVRGAFLRAVEAATERAAECRTSLKVEGSA
jgi:pyrroline-5-carboxylate reductase